MYDTNINIDVAAMASYDTCLNREMTSRVDRRIPRNVLDVAGPASFAASYEGGGSVGARMLAAKTFKANGERLGKTDHEHTVFAIC